MPPAGKQEQDPSSLAAELEAKLAKVRAEAIAGAKVLMRVLAPHSAFTFGGHTIGTEPTPVPAQHAAAITEAAADAGVNIEQEG